MNNPALTELIPIYTDDHGRIRVSGTRVLLDLIVYAYHQGQTPEHIMQMYPTLTLDNVYLTIGYYLRHRDTVDAYIQKMEAEADMYRQEINKQQSSIPTRAELLARLKSKRDNS